MDTVKAPPVVVTQLSAERNKALDRVYRKLDIRIISALWVLYFLTSYGGAAYGNSLTMNADVGHSLPQKLHMSDNDISVASSLSTVGFIVFDLPMNLIMSRVKPHAWMSRMMITVGITSACTAALKSASGNMILQFFGGVSSAGIWPGMTYYISLWYPDHRAVTRVGYYFTAAQLSCAVAGLLAAAFQKMDGARGMTGYQWNFLITGVITSFVGILLLWWLPSRPSDKKGSKVFPLNEEDAALHYEDMAERIEVDRKWKFKDLVNVFLDVRLWPLVLMYFGVVGTGIAIENYATVILQQINPEWSDIDLSLLTAPIWLFDLGGILLVTPFADRYRKHRHLIFSLSCAVIMCGLFVCTFAKNGWARWGGLLICGFGLGPTVPITMSLGSNIFYTHHGDLGSAMATAIISGFGNTGSVMTTKALYSGWPEDSQRNFRDSNMVMVAILGISVIAALCCTLLQYALGDFHGESLIDVTFLSWFTRRRRPATTGDQCESATSSSSSSTTGASSKAAVDLS